MSVSLRINVPMKTRDGVTLYADVYLPEPTGKFPLIVLRSPYNSETPGYSQFCADFCEHGIGVVCQAVRGTANSEGVFSVSRQENNDGEDFLNWIVEQDFCNGSIVTNGESYPGHTQWQLARHGKSILKGITPHNGPLNFYPVAMRPGGAWDFGLGTIWAFGMRSQRLHTPLKTPWKDAMWHLPLATMDTALGLEEWPLWHQWMTHVTYDDFWKGDADAMSDISKITCPAFITGGWFDAFLPQTMQAFSEMRAHAGSEQARKFTRCVIEPLDHSMRTHDIDYGPNHLDSIIETRNRFMENRLKHPDEDPLPDKPALRLFIMGSNRWMNAEEWPLPNTKYTPLYLHGTSAANTISGGGTLSFEAPACGGAECEEHFIYNPHDPVPSCGGNSLAPNSAGQVWQDAIEKRADVLVFTGEPMAEDTDVIGNVSAVIYAATSAKDTDFTVRLCDVYPDGRSVNVCDGIIRGRFLNGPEKEVFLEPDTVHAYKIDCWQTGWTFLKGHRIRVQVSSSNFPRFDRNLNNGGHLTESSDIKVAFQTVYHNSKMPSHILLPVIPK